MDALQAIITRCSVPAKLLHDPAPTGKDLDEIMQAAMRAPDHGALRPWRFIVVRGEARAALGEVFAAALCRRDPLADGATVAKEKNRPLRSPLMIVACAQIVENHPKVPPIEQIVSVGAAAQNMLNAAHAKGYAGIMLTGVNARDPLVKSALGLAPKDEIVAFLYLGTPADAPRAKRRPDPADFTREWTGPLGDARPEAAE